MDDHNHKHAELESMRARRPDIDAVEVADQGHAPLLTEDAIICRIGSFVAGCERSSPASTTR